MKSIRERILSIVTPPEQLPPGEAYIQREAIERRIQELEQIERLKESSTK